MVEEEENQPRHENAKGPHFGEARLSFPTYRSPSLAAQTTLQQHQLPPERLAACLRAPSQKETASPHHLLSASERLRTVRLLPAGRSRETREV